MIYDIKDLEIIEELAKLGQTDDELVAKYFSDAQVLYKQIKQYESFNEEQKEQHQALLAHQILDFYPSQTETVAILARHALESINYLTYLSELLHVTQSTQGAVKVDELVKKQVKVLTALGYDVEDTIYQATLAAQILINGANTN